MKKNIIFLLFILFPFINSICVSQNVKIDSLFLLLKKDKPDTNKLIHLYNLSNEYEIESKYSEGLKYAKQAIDVADKILITKPAPDFHVNQSAQKFKARAYHLIGIIYSDQSDYADALKNYFISLNIMKEIDYKKGMANSYNNIGGVFANQGNYPEALKNYYACLKIRESIGDKKGEASSYSNIGIVFSDQNNYPEALKNYYASLKIRKIIGDKKGIAYSYNNIGSVFHEQGNYPEALKNYVASLKIKEEIGDKRGVASSYNNIGLIYNAQGNYPQAMQNLLSSLKIKEEIGDKAGIATSYDNIGDVLIKQKKYKEAEDYIIKAKDLSMQIGYKEVLRNSYSALTALDSIKENYKGAYENNKQYILYRDSIDNEETRKKTIQSQMTYDFEKKEAIAAAEHKKELENQKLMTNEKSRKQKIILSFVVSGFLLVLAFAGFIFRSLNLTRKQKNIIEEQKLMVEEKQREIIDSITYARHIQQSLLPTEKYIARSLKRLMKK